jgi:hypothetical protein
MFNVKNKKGNLESMTMPISGAVETYHCYYRCLLTTACCMRTLLIILGGEDESPDASLTS